MSERKYEVLDEFGHVLASDMEFQMAMVFIEGYCERFWKERLNLTIREMDRCEDGCEERSEVISNE